MPSARSRTSAASSRDEGAKFAKASVSGDTLVTRADGATGSGGDVDATRRGGGDLLEERFDGDCFAGEMGCLAASRRSEGTRGCRFGATLFLEGGRSGRFPSSRSARMARSRKQL